MVYERNSMHDTSLLWLSNLYVLKYINHTRESFQFHDKKSAQWLLKKS